MRWRSIGLTTIVAVVTAAGVLPVAGLDLDENKIVDLTYTFGPDTVYWPTMKRFELETTARGEDEAGNWFAANNFCTAEHGGTHMDAPLHFAKGKSSMDQVPVTAGIGPLVRIDVSVPAATNPDYELSVADLQRWEDLHGPIPSGAVVVMYSGWGSRWPDAKHYLGTDSPNDATDLHFPGFSKEAAEFLVTKREIKSIGVDTPGIDYGQSRDFMVHRIINGADKPALENLANLDRVPPFGAALIALPMKIAQGTGAPVRAIALLP